MSFFNFSPETDKWTVSSKFWLYWIVAIPLTGLTMLFWFFFLRETGERRISAAVRVWEWRRRQRAQVGKA
jgi:hypothetical protein